MAKFLQVGIYNGVYSIEINSLKSFVNILSFLQTKAEASLERVWQIFVKTEKYK